MDSPMAFIEGAVIVFMLEPLIVVGEALAYTRFAGLRFLRALGTSVLANALSYLAGVLFWLFVSVFVFSGSWASREARWLLVLALALVVEVPIVTGINRHAADYKRLRKCAIFANCVSWYVVWLIVDQFQARLMG